MSHCLRWIQCLKKRNTGKKEISTFDNDTFQHRSQFNTSKLLTDRTTHSCDYTTYFWFQLRLKVNHRKKLRYS